MLKKIAILIGALLLVDVSLKADPWGKDADLVYFKPNQKQKIQESPPLVVRLGARAIQFHQEVISPADGPRSHFIPCSSSYTREAMQRYGFFYGFLLGCDRLMRENPEVWIYRQTLDPKGKLTKWNPVP